jgi:hypothetical protein
LNISNFYIQNSTSTDNTVDIVIDLDDDTQVLRWIRNVAPAGLSNLEVSRLPSSEPIPAGCTIYIRYRATASGSNSNLPNPFISIWGLSGPPCSVINEPSCGTQNFQLCTNPNTQAYRLDCSEIPLDQGVTMNNLEFTGLDFQTYTVSVVNNFGNAITDLLFYGESVANGTHFYQFFVDDVSVTTNCFCNDPAPFTCPCTATNTINIDASENGTLYSTLEAIHNYDRMTTVYLIKATTTDVLQFAVA